MEILTVIAIFTGPLVGVWMARWLEQLRLKKEARLWVFKTLMATREATLSLAHVEALNRIELEFNKRRDKNIRAAWRLYHDHLGKPINEQWHAKKRELFIDLLHSMSVELGYGDFDKTQIANSAYYPRGYGDAEDNQRDREKLLHDILKGEQGFPVKIINLPQPNPPLEEDKK